MKNQRLDIELVERGLVSSRALAQRLVMAGQVRVDDQVILKPATRVDAKSAITIETGPKFVSRGGEKLLAALQAFDLLDLSGWVCADVGASTGGFTDCLLQHGASLVYAIDVGYGLLDWKLRQDSRVVVMEKTNARFVTALEKPPKLVTVDASFISLGVLLPVISRWFQDQAGIVIALIKPQFEAGRRDAARSAGVIRDPEVHRKVLEQVIAMAQSQSYGVVGLIRSPLVGPKGNIEFLIRLDHNEPTRIDLQNHIEAVLVGPQVT